MAHVHVSRRRLLRNAGLAALAAPVLRRIEARAAATSPRRLILIYSPDGPQMVSGPATGTSDSNFTLHDWWKPLERHRADGIFLSNMAVTGGGIVTGNGHGLGGQTFCGFGAGYNGDQYVSKGPSIDQVIAKRLEADNRAGLRRSVVWGIGSSGGNGAFVAAPGRHITPEVDPSKAWADLFSGFVAPAASGSDAASRRAMLIQARDKSMLDFVNDDCAAMTSALGAEGMRLLDDHCTTLRSMERNLQSGLANPAVSACAKPANPGAMSWSNPENIDAQSAAFINLIGAALACELTYVVGFQHSGQAARNRLAAKYGVPSSPLASSGDSGPAHHPWTHQPVSDTRLAALGIFQTFYSNQVAALIDKLKSTVDVNGRPLLDSTMVVWASELGGNEKSAGTYHQTGSVPAVVFGRGQGLFKTGRYIQGKSAGRADPVASDAAYLEAGRDSARLLVSAMQYMGLTDVNTVGATGVSGPLMSLYA